MIKIIFKINISGALQYKATTAARISVACFLLHNMCIERRLPLPREIVEDVNVEEEEDADGEVNENGQHIRNLIVNTF